MHFCSKSALQLTMTRSVCMIWCKLGRCKAIVAVSGHAIRCIKQGQSTDFCCASIEMHTTTACEACVPNTHVVPCTACALNVLTFTLRSLSSWQHSRPSLPSTQQRSNTSNSNGTSLRESQVASPNVPCSCGSTDAAQDMDDALHDAQQLFKAAERVIKESCGEKWLLQPFIPDMERNEYRCQTTILTA